MTLQDEAAEPLYVIRPADNPQEAASQPDAPSVGQNSSMLGDMAPTLLFVFGMLLLIGILLRMLRKNSSRQADARDASATPGERIERLRTDATARAQIETFSAEAEELTRRLGAILDNKAARLELLIEEADQRLARLTRAESSVRTRPHEPESHAFHPSPAPIETTDPTHRRICELADEGLGPVEIAKRLEQPIGQVELILNLHKRRA